MSRKKAWSKTKAPAIEAAAADGEAATIAVEATGSEGAVTEAASEPAPEELIETEGEAVAIEAAFEPEPYELETIELDAIETPLADADEAALEAGIASVFDSILAEGLHVAANDDAGTSPQDGGDAASEEADPTVALLAELNRLWAQPLAA